jgi:hypothetical protein
MKGLQIMETDGKKKIYEMSSQTKPRIIHNYNFSK